jgi:GNAT superfamily N-acetyltransferase
MPKAVHDPILELTDAPDAGSMAVIAKGLRDFNTEVTGTNDHRPLAVFVKDAAGKTLGGVLGRTYLGLMFLDTFYLPKSGRGAGVGSKVLAMAEAEGRQRGCKSAVLYTISFQAPEFYKRHGWQVFGEIPCDPPGASRIFLTKAL